MYTIIYIMSEDTSIRLKKTTKERLEKLGKYGETHDGIVNKLLDERGNFGDEKTEKS